MEISSFREGAYGGVPRPPARVNIRSAMEGCKRINVEQPWYEGAQKGGAPMNMPALVVLFAASSVAAQQRTIEPKDVEVFNRSVSALSDGTRKGVRLNEQPGEGVAYLKGIEFTNGTIEFVVRGKDVQGQSFVGVAVHGLDSTTYDAIYLRPFNFRTEDPARHSHAVQYISHPSYTWQKLRAERPGAFEQPVSPAPDPNAWFHV